MKKKIDTYNVQSSNLVGYFGSYSRFSYWTHSNTCRVHWPSDRGVTVRICRVWTIENCTHKSRVFHTALLSNQNSVLNDMF